jgi:Protein phosphatase 2C
VSYSPEQEIQAATLPGGDAPNEDWYCCSPGTIAVLDGVTVGPGIESGCHHGTPWYVARLGGALLAGAAVRPPSLRDVLAAGIAEVAALHADGCDLDTIGAPSAALAVVRVREDTLEWLVLGDVTVVIDTAAGIRAVTDDRVAASVAGLDIRSADLGVRIGAARAAHRNRPGGYWVAAADPDAAAHALTGSVPLNEVRRVMVLTDGAARLVDLFGSTWDHALDIGPVQVLAEVRALEAADPDSVRYPRIKARDDATALTWPSVGGDTTIRRFP